MTRDKIISMALEAGFDSVGTSVYTWAGQHNITKELEQFAGLVAAIEREACAVACEDIEFWGRVLPTPDEYAEIIRARSYSA